MIDLKESSCHRSLNAAVLFGFGWWRGKVPREHDLMLNSCWLPWSDTKSIPFSPAPHLLLLHSALCHFIGLNQPRVSLLSQRHPRRDPRFYWATLHRINFSLWLKRGPGNILASDFFLGADLGYFQNWWPSFDLDRDKREGTDGDYM